MFAKLCQNNYTTGFFFGYSDEYRDTVNKYTVTKIWYRDIVEWRTLGLI